MTGDEKQQLTDIGTIIAKLQAGKFYGSLEIKFEAGNIVLIKKTESIKLSK